MTTKTRRIIKICVSVILVAASLLTLSWFYVSGSELRFLQDIPADCTAGVSIWSWDEAVSDYKADLTYEQLTQLLELLQSSSYWRIPTPSISYSGHKTIYTVFITYKIDGIAQYLTITSTGDYAVNIDSSQEFPFKYDFLRLRDKDWVAKLNAILSPQ